MEVDNLAALVTVWKLQSFSRAADVLGLNQPTLSKQISHAESEFGVKILDRSKRPIVPTPGGLALLQRIELAVELLKGNSSVYSDRDQGDTVSVAATEDITSALILGAGVNYQRMFPRSLLKIIPIDGNSGVSASRLLEEQKVDVAVMHAAPRSEALEFEPLFLFERILVVPRGHILESKQNTQVALEDIAAFPLVLTSPRIPNHRMLEEQLDKHEIPYRISLEVHGIHLITKAVALGFGVSVLGNTSVLMEDQGGLTTINLSHLMPRDVGGVAYRRGQSLSKSAQTFITSFKQFCKNRAGLSVPNTHSDVN